MRIARIAAAATLGLVLAGGSITGAAVAAPTATQPVRTAPAQDPMRTIGPCHIRYRVTAHHEGWTAGYSWAWNTIVGYGNTGHQVKEIQCLVRRWKGSVGYVSPGPLDGIYGSRTRAAVRYVQSTCHLSVDGVVGPHTWRCLRRF